MTSDRRLTAALCVLTLLPTIVHAQDDIADVPSERIALADKQAYFLINRPQPDDKPRPLVLVLPGGDGGEAFNPFVRRMTKNALPTDCVVAQLVAVASDHPRQIVWPTALTKDPKQAFTTESFIAAVIADVGKRARIDPQHVYALGWSSSGPALYTLAATKDSPVRGYFLAMSIFRPNLLPTPEATEGKRFYLLHSPGDRVCPFRMAQAARDKLTALKADATLAEYEGGHGWHGDVFGDIKTGMQWLMRQAAEKQPPTTAPET